MLVSLLNALDPYAPARAPRKQKDDRQARSERRDAGKPDARRADAAEPAQAGFGTEPAEEADVGAPLPEDALDGQALCALLKAKDA